MAAGRDKVDDREITGQVLQGGRRPGSPASQEGPAIFSLEWSLWGKTLINWSQTFPEAAAMTEVTEARPLGIAV